MYLLRTSLDLHACYISEEHACTSLLPPRGTHMFRTRCTCGIYGILRSKENAFLTLLSSCAYMISILSTTMSAPASSSQSRGKSCFENDSHISDELYRNQISTFTHQKSIATKSIYRPNVLMYPSRGIQMYAAVH
jgi:hypothetical protein